MSTRPPATAVRSKKATSPGSTSTPSTTWRRRAGRRKRSKGGDFAYMMTIKGAAAMKRFLVGFLLSGLIVIPAFAALKQGEKAPDFSAKASLAGKEFNFSLKAALAKGPVVVYFYPSAFTGGCNLEAHTFAENKEKFDALKASIIGVSSDSIAR